MLVVTRKTDEELIIGDEIRVQVVEVRGGRVKLGVEAPSWMSIRRGELVENDPPESTPPADRSNAA